MFRGCALAALRKEYHIWEQLRTDVQFLEDSPLWISDSDEEQLTGNHVCLPCLTVES